MIESVGDSENDQPPPRPVGVHTQESELPSYSKMMAALIDQVKIEVDEEKAADRFGSYVKAVEGHKTKVEGLQSELLNQLNILEKEEGRKITSESYTTGFSTSHVSKSEPIPAVPPKSNKKVQAVEVLNPAALKNQLLDRTESSGADADVDEPEAEDSDEEVECSPEGKAFGNIKLGDYRACLEFISKNPKVLAEKETDGLLVLAFNAAIESKDELSRQYVHQGLLLQYCRALGRDGVQLFFKRITTQGHQAQKVFFDDVQSTYARIKVRTKEIVKQRTEEENEGAGTEQIQLHAVDPGTTINIKVPAKDSTDEDEIKARQAFDSFPPGLQRALESGSLDEINKVLGKMSVEEAEEIVAQLGEVSLAQQSCPNSR